MLQWRTMSYSDTQRYRVGPNYLQLPINSPKKRVGTNQRDGQMTYFVDTGGENPYVNYEPSSLGGLKEADRAGNKDHTPYVAGNLVRQKIDRENNFKQAGERYRTIEQWERDDLVFNMSDMLSQCNKDIQERMIGLLRQCDEEYGQRVADNLKNGKSETATT
jgi:catalase